MLRIGGKRARDAENPTGHIVWLESDSSDELPEPGPEVDDMGRFIFRLCVGYILVVGGVVSDPNVVASAGFD